LFDSAKIQESDAEYANRRGFSKHQPAQPLFDSRDVARALRQFQQVPRLEWFSPMMGKGVEPIRIKLHDAGHLLGSCMIEVEIHAARGPTRMLFSGDVGRYNAPLYHDPSPPPPCDYLVCESTYGDRDHPEIDLLDALTEVVLTAVRRGGVMLVAAFAIGRAQQLIYLLRVLMHHNRIPELPIFLDSPMAADATALYSQYSADHDLTEGQLSGRDSVLSGRNVHLARTVAESKEINAVGGPAVIISSSGMMTGGRILHHLRQRLPDARNTVVLGGFMAAGTRGRLLQDGARTLRMHGRDVPVRAAIDRVSGLSGHADRGELLRWLEPLSKPRRVFLTHGEPPALAALAQTLRDTRGWDVTIPRLDELVDLGD
jgi:metallo-beta-lactamase family protein